MGIVIEKDKPMTSCTGSATLDWLLYEAPSVRDTAQLLEEFCNRLLTEGVPVARALAIIPALHPLYFGTAYIWRGSGAIERRRGLWENRNAPEYQESPIRAVIEEGADALRRRLTGPKAQLDFPVLTEFRDEGLTDYALFGLSFGSGRRSAISFSTREEGGFPEEALAKIDRLMPILTRLIEIHALRATAVDLLDTYVGHDAGARILNGQIRRGMSESLHAAIWYCDLRDFTAMSEKVGREEIVASLDAYFETMAAAVQESGGEILKFIGDAMLAIFPVTEDEGVRDATGKALAAAAVAEHGMAALNVKRVESGRPALDYGLSLHIGEVMYGNIGAADRLDFTVIGPAVNLASRVEALCRITGRRPLMTDAFRQAAGVEAEPMGRFSLRGVSEEQEVFSPVALPLPLPVETGV
jgi:adenylate cyclase